MRQLIHYLAIKARVMGSFASLEPTQTLFGDYGNLRFVVESQASPVFCNGIASRLSRLWFIGGRVGISVAVLSGSQSHDISIGITHQEMNSCLNLWAAGSLKIFRSTAEHLAE